LVAALRPPSSIFKKGWTTHASRDLLEMQPDGTLGKKLLFTLPATRTLSTMWLEWTLEDNCPSLPPQGRTVSHPHSHQTEGLTDLLGLAAED
jgi:hypothetical protein